jgi:hypothetical protein
MGLTVVYTADDKIVFGNVDYSTGPAEDVDGSLLVQYRYF